MDNKINNDIDVEEINGIKNEISLSPTEIKADLTKTINEAYKDGLKPAMQETGKGLKFCFQFLASKVKPYMYESIEEAEYKCREIDIKLEEKYNKIPKENRVQPRTSIVGPTLDILKYNLDEEHIKEIFINLLSSEMDGRKQNEVLPAYINIVNQLSRNDADFLKKLHSFSNTKFPIIKIKLEFTTGYTDISNYILVINNNDYIVIAPIVLDNLLRLKILEIPYGISMVSTKEDCKSIFNKIKEMPEIHIFNTYFNHKDYKEVSYTEAELKFTDFGKTFIDICLS